MLPPLSLFFSDAKADGVADLSIACSALSFAHSAQAERDNESCLKSQEGGVIEERSWGGGAVAEEGFLELRCLSVFGLVGGNADECNEDVKVRPKRNCDDSRIDNLCAANAGAPPALNHRVAMHSKRTHLTPDGAVLPPANRGLNGNNSQ
ncbi:hypothetical protein EVAR_54175_1 [Eumeta japonica]|uniref:Uncharacterized protein n=1 Tax=Eumeta variegata TaxID=151549 RepID=A0A4C1Y490_EUMVA|nr:hypothetical protein EVAR_54175_1 [Eumeta japonica]